MKDLNLIVSLDPENLSTPDRRQSVAYDLFHAQIMPHDEAERLCELLWKDSQGESMLPSLRQWCADRRKLVEDFAKLEIQRAEAWAEQSRHESLKANRAELAEKLAGLRGHLAVADRFVNADHVSGLERHMLSGPPVGDPFSKALVYGRDLAGARELATVLKKSIAYLEKEIADADAELTEFQKQLNVRPAAVAEAVA